MKKSNQSQRAFTIVELLVVLAVLAVFGLLLGPTLAQDNKAHVTAIRCLDNHRQLIKAWLTYAVDSEDYVANNYTIPGTEAAINKWRTTGFADAWAPNVMAYTVGTSSHSITNKALAAAGLLVPYHGGNIDVYHCPSDFYLSAVQKAARWKYRLRSVAMNSNWGRTDPAESKNGSPTSWAYGAGFRQWHRLAEVRKPAERYVFVDEHADSINDGFFLVTFGGGGGSGEYPSTVAGGQWGDIPGFYHNKSTPFGFADGHTEMKKWFSRPIPVRAGLTFVSGPADIRDQRWYVQHVAERL